MEYFDAAIHVNWPKGKRLAVYQVQALDEGGVLHQLQVIKVAAYGLNVSPPRKRDSRKTKQK